MKTKIILLLLVCLVKMSVNAQRIDMKVPTDVQPFVEKNTLPIALESADLNGDGKKDYILVLERQTSEKEKEDYQKNERLMLILIRDNDGKLSEVKRNESIVLCSKCGGVFGDPFDGVEVGKNTFTVRHYGGSNWRWSNSYKFNYSRIDNTWQLVRLENTNFHTSKPDKVDRKIKTPPKDFGKVDISEFDADDFEEYNTKNLIEFKNGAYTAQARGKFNKIGDDVTFNVKAITGQRMIVNIIPISKGLATAATVTSPSGEQDGMPGGFIMNSILKESGYYKIRVTQRPTDHEFPAEFVVEVVLLPSFLNDEIVTEKTSTD